MEERPDALPPIRRCVLSRRQCADRIFAAPLKMDALGMVEYDRASNQVGFVLSQTSNIGTQYKYFNMNV